MHMNSIPGQSTTNARQSPMSPAMASRAPQQQQQQQQQANTQAYNPIQQYHPQVLTPL